MNEKIIMNEKNNNEGPREFSSFRHLKRLVIYLKDNISAISATLQFYTSDKYWLPQRSIFRENRYRRIVELEEKKKDFEEKKKTGVSLDEELKRELDLQIRQGIFQDFCDDIRIFPKEIKKLPCIRDFIIPLVRKSLLGKGFSLVYNQLQNIFQKFEASPEFYYYHPRNWLPPRMFLDPLMILRCIGYFYIFTLNLYGKYILEKDLYFNEIKDTTAYAATPEGSMTLMTPFLAKNISEEEFYHDHDINPLGDHFRWIQTAMYFMRCVRYQKGPIHKLYPIRWKFKDHEPGFPNSTHWYETFATFEPLPQLQELGINGTQDKLVRLLITFLTNNNVDSIIPSIKEYQTAKTEYSNFSNNLAWENMIEKAGKIRNYYKLVYKASIKKIPAFHAVTIIHWPTRRNWISAEVLQGEFGKYPQFSYTPSFIRAGYNTTSRTVQLTRAFLKGVVKRYPHVHSKMFSSLKSYFENGNIPNYSIWKRVVITYVETGNLTEWKENKYLNDEQNQWLIDDYKDGYYDYHYEPGFNFQCIARGLMAGFSTQHDRFLRHKFEEQTWNSNTFDDRKEQIYEWVDNWNKFRIRYTNLRRCPVYGSSDRCKEVSVMLNYGIGLPLIGIFLTCFSMINWYQFKDSNMRNFKISKIEQFWTFLCGSYYYRILFLTVRAYRTVVREDNRSSYWASIPDFVGEASLRMAVTLYITTTKNEFLPACKVGFFLSFFYYWASIYGHWFENTGRNGLWGEFTNLIKANQLEFPEPWIFRYHWEPLLYHILLAIGLHFHTIHGRNSIGWYGWIVYLVYARNQWIWNLVICDFVIPSIRYVWYKLRILLAGDIIVSFGYYWFTRWFMMS